MKGAKIMPWYGWLPWILFVLVTAGFIIYVVVRKPKTPAELREQVAKLDREYKAAKAELVKEKVARQKAEKDKAAKELELLELQHAERLKALKEKEQKDYEAAKNDPQSGVDFIRGLLDGDDSQDSPS